MALSWLLVTIEKNHFDHFNTYRLYTPYIDFVLFFLNRSQLIRVFRLVKQRSFLELGRWQNWILVELRS